jgi:hypothetical protein
MAVVATALPFTSAAMSERSTELINSFRTFCSFEAPGFSHVDEMATAMKLPFRDELEASRADPDKSRSWLVFLGSGPHELAASEMSDPNGRLTVCGIRAPDADGEEFLRTLIPALELKVPVSVETSGSDQHRTTTWKLDIPSYDITLVLIDNTPVQKPGINLRVFHLVPIKS